MKIILCTFLLCITTVSVFGQSVELHGILGQSVKFPAAVKKGGSLMHSSVTIGDVTSGRFTPSRNENYRGRLQWDSITGLFSLSGLKMEDIGEYKVQNTDQNIITVFQLNVYTVSVFGEPQELHGILGKSIEFPAAVKKGGYLMHSSVSIGESSLEPPGVGKEKYSGRVQWDSCTGLFSLSGLKMEDIGGYEVQNTDKNIITVFQLNVYKDNVPVSKPHVNVTRNEYRCTLLCTVDKGARATLSWYREGEKESYGSSPVESAPHLYLPLSVERSGTYTCKAKNSVSNETSDPLTVGAHCTVTDSFSTGRIVFLSVAVAALIAGVCAVCCCCIRRGIPGIRRGIPGIRRGIPGFRKEIRAVGAFIRAKKLLDDVDLPENGETITPDAVRKLIQVKKILDNVDPHEYGIRRKI